MKKPNVTTLGYAILGLLHVEPRTGYALRKVFETTPMGHYSSSPGAIYPALKRLEERGLASSKIDDSTKLRPKQVYSTTRTGVDFLRYWVSQPIEKQNVVHDLGDLMLRFSFMGTLVNDRVTYRFLSQMASGINLYVGELEQMLQDMPVTVPPHGRLALQSGISTYRAQANWARQAMREFASEAERDAEK
jgi:DNA-binding PadR family transcriptional regulator